MLLFVIVAVCLVSVPLTGGRLSGVLTLELRHLWLVFTAFTLQVIITTVIPAGDRSLHEALHVLSYVMAAGFIVANRHVKGLPLLAFGGAMNLLAITANHGVMPASATAMRLAGLPQPTGFANSAALVDPNLLVLGDVLPIPGPGPLANVLSVGDLLIFAGLIIMLNTACTAQNSTKPIEITTDEPAAQSPAAQPVHLKEKSAESRRRPQPRSDGDPRGTQRKARGNSAVH